MKKLVLLVVVGLTIAVSFLLKFEAAKAQETPSGELKESGIKSGSSDANATLVRLRDMKQIAVKLGTAESKTPTLNPESSRILVSGIASEDVAAAGTTQNVRVAGGGFQIFDKNSGASILGPSDISTIWVV